MLKKNGGSAYGGSGKRGNQAFMQLKLAIPIFSDFPHRVESNFFLIHSFSESPQTSLSPVEKPVEFARKTVN
jgi:hypothetical protein